jgi:hypothetical protein
MKKLLLASALVILPALSAFAADNAWVGTWKLDLEKSQFTGNTFTILKSENGLYHFSNGSNVGFDFGIDGKEYKTVYGRTVIWTAAGDNAWDTVRKQNGIVLANIHRQLSPDGKTLTMTETGTKPDGSTFNNENVYTRVSGSQGLIGKWKSTKARISAPDSYVVSAPSEGVMRWEIPEYKEIVEGKTDGSDLPVTGPTAPAGLTLSIKILSPTKLIYKVKVNGQLNETSIETLSADGRTLTIVSWNPGRKSEKSTAVFIKQ